MSWRRNEAACSRQHLERYCRAAAELRVRTIDVATGRAQPVVPWHRKGWFNSIGQATPLRDRMGGAVLPGRRLRRRPADQPSLFQPARSIG